MLEGEANISTQAAVLMVAVPVFVFLVGLFGTYTALVRELDPFHGLLLAAATRRTYSPGCARSVGQ